MIDDDQRLERRQFRDELGDGIRTIEHLAPVLVAVGSDEHFGLDLLEAIEHALRPEIRSAY